MSYPNLSKRETEVIEALFLHATNEGIATDLQISCNTVKTHLKNIYKKLDVHSKTELVLKIRNPENHPDG